MMKNISRLLNEYRETCLNETELPNDPLDLFGQWFEIALHQKLPEPNAMVLSTASRLGKVTARAVLLKGIEKGRFVFYTNYRSVKGIQLSENPQAALTFLWLPLERQVRVEGKVRKLSRKNSVDYFNSRPVESRISASVSPQSCVIPDRSFLTSMREGFMLDLGDHEPDCPKTWGGYGLNPDLIEFWQGGKYRLHDRIRYRRKKQTWTIDRLAP